MRVEVEDGQGHLLAVAEELHGDGLGDLADALLEAVEERVEVVAERLVEVGELEVGPQAAEQPLGPGEATPSSDPRRDEVLLDPAQAEQHAARERARQQQELEDVGRVERRPVRLAVRLRRRRRLQRARASGGTPPTTPATRP